jgi:hypothetical protein
MNQKLHTVRAYCVVYLEHLFTVYQKVLDTGISTTEFGSGPSQKGPNLNGSITGIKP